MLSVTARGMLRSVYIYTWKAQFISFRTFNVNITTMKSMQSLIFHSAIASLVLECFTILIFCCSSTSKQIDEVGRLGLQSRYPVSQPKLENKDSGIAKPRRETPHLNAYQKEFPGGMYTLFICNNFKKVTAVLRILQVALRNYCDFSRLSIACLKKTNWFSDHSQ